LRKTVKKGIIRPNDAVSQAALQEGGEHLLDKKDFLSNKPLHPLYRPLCTAELDAKKYSEFLATKSVTAPSSGIEVALNDIHPILFDFQKQLVQWALCKSQAAIFADCGLGKTLMQLEWARIVCQSTGGAVLILAPLAVASQTVTEGRKIGVEVRLCREQSDVRAGINICNYEMLQHFSPDCFVGVVLDESSILKSYMGKTKRQLVDVFAHTLYKLCCTATPAPNDHMELGNHSEFLGIMPSPEMLMRFFINDTMANGHYRLKGHAVADFWSWVASWAISLKKPSDLGYSDEGFALPELLVKHCYVGTDITASVPDGQLFRAPTMSATTIHKEGRLTVTARAQAVADMVNGSDDTWAIWCNTNYEADELVRLIPDALEVRGSESLAEKERKITLFTQGNARILIGKASMLGYGLNWQHCHKTAFVGLSYSFEDFYQAVRRLYRFGQKHPVEVTIVAAETESPLVASLERKIHAHTQMSEAMNSSAQLSLQKNRQLVRNETFTSERGQDWMLYRGDCVTVTKTLPENSIDFTIFSPPFSGLYIYSDAIEDMGNSADDDEFFAHFDFLIPELLRVTRPGRLCAVHCKQLVNYKGRDGAAGLRDFRGEIIRHFEQAGWQYHSEVCIWKDPVNEMQKTKANGLLYKTIRRDASFSRMGIPEYLLLFRKWAQTEADEELVEAVVHTKDDFPLETWQRYASPVWFDINQTRVLNVEQARESQDEKHICPLQLDVIERAVQLWSNPGDTVLSPFCGIGSEGHESLRLGRKFVGIELKESYFQVAARNLKRMEQSKTQATLFDMLEVAG
jgi:DNA modification methylase